MRGTAGAESLKTRFRSAVYTHTRARHKNAVYKYKTILLTEVCKVRGRKRNAANLRLNESLTEMCGNKVLKGVSDAIETQAAQHKQSLEVIQVFVPLARQTLPVWLVAVEDETEAGNVVLKVRGERRELGQCSKLKDVTPGSSRQPLGSRIGQFFGPRCSTSQQITPLILRTVINTN